MSKKLVVFLCLVLFVAFASAAPKKATKKNTKQTEQVTGQSKKASKKSTSKKNAKKPEPVVEEPVEEDDDDEFISAPDTEEDSGEDTATEDSTEAVVDGDGMFTNAQLEERLSRKKFEEEQRLDEYANSERRRDWLKDRLILEVGMGSRYPIMGETGIGMGLGFGAEYITRWHVGMYGSMGWVPEHEDNNYKEYSLEGGFGYKIGVNYYFLPKNPLHVGLSASYGTVYYDHDIRPDKSKTRPIITVNGFQFDALITYMTQEWYYLQFSIGAYYAPDLKSKDLSNPSFGVASKTDATPVSYVIDPDGMSKSGIVFGIAIGYAFPEFFPDDTEIRRREREKERARVDNRIE